MNLTEQQNAQLQEKGISPETITEQKKRFEKGFPLVKLYKEAIVGDGIVQIGKEQQKRYASYYEQRLDDLEILKFVPASGAATRMFRFLHEFLQKYDPSDRSITSYINKEKAQGLFSFIIARDKFPFYDAVMSQLKNKYSDWDNMSERMKKVNFIKLMMQPDGFNYGSMPKGLIPFHKYDDRISTAFEEHLLEAASYATSNGKARLHFTIAPDFREDFKDALKEIQKRVENKTGITYEITFSHQQASTDTIAVDMNNNLITDNQGNLFFRPAGHGALLTNLDQQDADVIFIKNIDNVTIESLLEEVSGYKKTLAGLLLELQDQSFKYLRLLEQKSVELPLVQEIEQFLENQLCNKLPKDYHKYAPNFKIEFLRECLNRPLRVCGMVKNEGEPGGGPFWVANDNGEVSLQIVESAQVDKDNPKQVEIASSGTHFNPVDIVCGVRDYTGTKFNLMDYSDPETGFITYKSRMGKKLKAQELPGLWNGAMAHWNTVFVEVPLITFNPVKTVNDLLKPAHQF
jgi:hypothetical protein